MAAGNPGPVIPERYRKALGSDDPIQCQREAPGRLRALIAGLDEKQLAARTAPGKWSIKDVISHLADGEVIYGARMRFVGAHDRPAILGYDQDAFVERLGVDRARAADLVDAFEHARAANLELIARLPSAAFDRVGIHSERGEESIAAMVSMLAGHDRVHEEQIRGIRAELGF